MSPLLTDQLNGGTILMDACKIQGLNSYFAKFKDEFGWCVKIQGRNASDTHTNTHFSTHSIWLVKIHMGPTKFIWDPHALVGPMWILTNQRECVEKCVLECVLLTFLIKFYKYLTFKKDSMFWYNILFYNFTFCLIFFFYLKSLLEQSHNLIFKTLQL